MEEVTVVIVGAGPSGLALGALLGRMNVKVCVCFQRRMPVRPAMILNAPGNNIGEGDGGLRGPPRNRGQRRRRPHFPPDRHRRGLDEEDRKGYAPRCCDPTAHCGQTDGGDV